MLARADASTLATSSVTGRGYVNSDGIRRRSGRGDTIGGRRCLQHGEETERGPPTQDQRPDRPPGSVAERRAEPDRVVHLPAPTGMPAGAEAVDGDEDHGVAGVDHLRRRRLHSTSSRLWMTKFVVVYFTVPAFTSNGLEKSP